MGQVRDVINGKTVLGEQKEIQEVKNAYAAYEKFFEINPYSIQDLKKFHGIMTKYVVKESGDFRRGEEGVFNGGQCIFMAPLSECIKRLLDSMEYNIPYTSKALMEKLGLKSKEGFLRNYLRPATYMNLIRMTIPDKPNSRNQRYIKV